MRRVINTGPQTKSFALEEDMKEEIEKGNIPYAVHAWEKHYPELLQKKYDDT